MSSQEEIEMKSKTAPLADSPHSWPEDYHFENGNYECICASCGAHFIGYKRRLLCAVCADGSFPPAQGTRARLQSWLSRRPYSLENLAISIVYSIIWIGGGISLFGGSAREAFLAAFSAGGSLAITWLFLDRRE